MEAFVVSPLVLLGDALVPSRELLGQRRRRNPHVAPRLSFLEVNAWTGAVEWVFAMRGGPLVTRR